MTRVVMFTLVAYLAAVALGPLQLLFGIETVTVDVPLVIVLYLAMLSRRGHGRWGTSNRDQGLLHVDDVILILVLGYLTDLLVANLKGTTALQLGVVYLVARMLVQQVYLVGAFPQIVVTLIASLVASMVGLGIRWVGGLPPTLAIAPAVLGNALVTATLAPVLIRFLQGLEKRMQRVASERASLFR